MSSSESSARNPFFVTFAIVLADLILCGLVHWGSGLQLDANLPASIWPTADRVEQSLPTICWYSIHVLTALVALYFCKRTGLRNFLNTFLFIQTTLAMAWVTAHTGGLWRSIYGPGYLALFPVATIVPSSSAIKFWAALPVGAFALLMALYAPDRGHEMFVWVTSIVGCSLGWGIQQFLLKLTAKE